VTQGPFAVSYDLSDGPAGAPVVVLSCSLGTDRTMWDPQLPALGERFRVLRYDLRGHGASPVPTGPYEIGDLGADLVALLDRLDVPSAHLCGVSIGGMLSLWTAAHHPERVERMVVCCTSAYIDPTGSYRDRAAAVRADGMEPLLDAALERWFTPRFRTAHPDVAQHMRAVLASTPVEGYAGCCEALAAMDLRGDLPAVEAPTLVIAAADDPATPPEHGALIADGVRAARLEVVASARHLASIEQSGAVSELILRHLTTEEPR
jgi:3-oxoadipate enol-lactonase